jgi:lipid-binding SYLF domain-containing protein
MSQRPREKVKTMKKIILSLALVGMSTLGWADSKEAAADRLEHASAVLHEVMAAPDKGIPEEVLDHAKCIAVVPHMVKGGFVFGAQGGKGVATCRTASGWSAPAFFTIGGGSWGLQIGVEGIDLVMIIQSDHGMEHLLSSKFQIGGDASAAAGPVGRHASADTDWKLNTEILTYSRAKGIFAGLTLNGQVINRDDDAMDAFYGAGVSSRAVLHGEVPPPAAAMGFLHAVHEAKEQAMAQ